MSTVPIAFSFLLCKQPISLLGPLGGVTTEKDEVVDVLSKQYEKNNKIDSMAMSMFRRAMVAPHASS